MSDASSQSSLTFVHGFLLGYLSVCLLLFFFIKFFIFGDVPPSPSSRRRTPYSSHQRATSFSTSFLSSTSYTSFNASKKSSVLRRTPPYTIPTILAKTYYNTRNHQPESVDWFNVLVAQALAQLRTDAQQDDAILKSLTELLNGSRRPDFLDEIKVTEVNLGEEFPIFSNCRIIPVDGEGASIPNAGAASRPNSSRSAGGSSNEKDQTAGTRLQARMDVDLSDAITLGIETKVVLHFPRRYVASMPVALAVSVVRFSGTLNVSFVPSSLGPVDASASGSRRTAPTSLTFSFSPDYRLELSTRSLLGSRARLQDVPKIAQLVEARLHDWFDQRCVEPRFQQIVLPSLWPRAQNTRGGGSEDDSLRNTDPRRYETQRKSFEEAIETDDDPSAYRHGPAHVPLSDGTHSYSNAAPPSYNGSTMRKRNLNHDSPHIHPVTEDMDEDARYDMPGSLPL